MLAAFPTSALASPVLESSIFERTSRRSSATPSPKSERSSPTSSPSVTTVGRVSSLTRRSRTSRPPLTSFNPSPPPQFIKLASFSDDTGFGDLLSSSRPTFADDPYSAFPANDQDDDLATNPFADMASSSVVYPTATQQESYYHDEPVSPATPAREGDVSFLREDAPEPETPASAAHLPVTATAYSTYDDTLYEPQSPLATTVMAPASPSEQTPFGSPPTSPPLSTFHDPAPLQFPAFPADPTPHSPSANKADMSVLLGEEKPTLPSFSKPKRKEREAGVAGPLGSKIAVLPVSSVGRKPVGGALAALLGLEVEEEAQVQKPEDRTEIRADTAVPEKEAQSPKTLAVAENVDDAAPEPRAQEGVPEGGASSTTASEPEHIDHNVVKTALETPLPASPPATDIQQTDDTAATADDDATPVLSRMPSAAPSTLSRTSSTTENIPYDSMVSPLDPSADENGERRNAAWPANKAIDAVEAKLAAVDLDAAGAQSAQAVPETPNAGSEAPSEPSAEPQTSGPDPSYSQYIFSNETSVASTPTPSRGFRAFNGSGDEGGFGGTDDADSLRGAYSRSLEPGDAEEVEADHLNSVSSRSDAVDREESVQSQREGSAPLPPLPSASVQGSPRSKDLGGSLGPSFIISVGDPQTVGKNPASQHTVFTVRTRTSSPAFRKSDFSVLRRYSHFVWLYDALMQNNPGVIVPGMPEKHVIGRFGSDFIENRRLGLQAALNKIVAHPMLVGDPDLRLFLESDSFHIDIKQRKIDNSHESKGFLAHLSSSISGPKFVEFDEYFDNRRHTLEIFETQLRTLLASLTAAAKARAALQASIAELQSAFLALAESDLSTQLRRLLSEAAGLQRKLHDLSEAQAVSDEQIGGLVSVAESYARMCASARGVFGARIKAYHSWQAADSRLRKAQAEHEKGKRLGRTHSELLPESVAVLADAERRMLDARHDFEDVSKLTKAEMARFDKEKVDDFKRALEEYADSLAARQREVVSGWQEYYDLLVRSAEANADVPAPAN